MSEVQNLGIKSDFKHLEGLSKLDDGGWKLKAHLKLLAGGEKPWVSYTIYDVDDVAKENLYTCCMSTRLLMVS